MNAKGELRTQRRLRFRRLRRGEKQGARRAVSPVVATLILILIAVAAAAALYLWLVAWQGGVTAGIGNPGAQYTLTIGGSTSVYPFATLAATQFEQNNSDVKISVNQGGSGAGVAAVCSGQVDIGEASAFEPASTLTADGCNTATAAIEIVAYDGVDPILATGNDHGVLSMSWDTLQAIYTTASNSAPTSGISLGDGYLLNGISGGTGFDMNGVLAPVQTAAYGDSYVWDQIPACAEAGSSGTLATCAGVAETTTPAAVSQTIAGPTSLVGGGTVTVSGNTLGADCTAGQLFDASGTDTLAVTGYTSSGAVDYPMLAQPVLPALACTGVVFTYTDISDAVTYAAGTVSIAWEEQATVSTAGSSAYAPPVTAPVETTPSTLAGIVQTVPVTLTANALSTASCGGSFPHDICATTVTGTLNTVTSSSSCGFTVCAGGLATGTGAGDDGATIQTAYRSDVSGTQQSFLARLLAVGTANTAGTIAINFNGCGGDNQWDGCGMSLSTSNSHGENGNPAVIAYVAATPDAIGFASDGLVQASGSGTGPINFQGFGQSVVVTIQGESVALGAIAKGIAAYDSGTWSATAAAYVGWRPFENIETAPPTGEALRYLQFVMDPANNENLAAEAQEISVYASGLAGTVPVTPIP